MPRYPKLSSKDVERVLVKHGFTFVSQKGSHKLFFSKENFTKETHKMAIGLLERVFFENENVFGPCR
ncbi:MAG: type II toxin-antitoxin system HicA family toxin [Candidatus Methanospirareceae archaeon]